MGGFSDMCERGWVPPCPDSPLQRERENSGADRDGAETGE